MHVRIVKYRLSSRSQGVQVPLGKRQIDMGLVWGGVVMKVLEE